ncbi:Fe-S oxidoreductase [Clostridium botulinum]|uniref:Uncharacterized protein n=1 Tax=Clostridium botulinum (strain Okra / Type B1) TaxID=498213 RepID=B1IJV6_CLOBK|nr:hypothetical protein [Clostridium botulinum]EKX79401.1 hypothetical protein CFSAN001628_013098 [Clostridium botulinum CFSAN001628]ACA45901.1 hypothetical protein CLD_3229 [Clostridium botulinum B1 str. Okra]MBD5562677.1 Fe-S oxidoreductase [Clostridium botulinum]MBD5565836.1 Fe-S oxidoreductase [Clostridium botulinum]MBD5569646.1 Fe-S oxidoreductase [Clostridium botulinum]
MAFEILTDEIKHVIKYNYILNTTHKNKKITGMEKDEDMNKHDMRTIMW